MGWVSLLLLLLGAGPAAAQGIHFFGQVGDLPVAAVLERQEGELEGWYFYLSKGRLIELRGSIDAQGAFTLQERSEGKVTGVLAGQVQGERWSGTWRKAVGAPPLALELKENRDPLKNLSGDFACQVKRRDAKSGFTFRWELKLSVRAGRVSQLQAEQGSQGDDGDQQSCSLSLEDLRQVPAQAGLLLKVKDPEAQVGEAGEGDGEGGCALRILANERMLWVRIGQPSEEGQDCRRVGSQMFCTPRAFWSDVVIDRRDRSCRPLH